MIPVFNFSIKTGCFKSTNVFTCEKSTTLHKRYKPNMFLKPIAKIINCDYINTITIIN